MHPRREDNQTTEVNENRTGKEVILCLTNWVRQQLRAWASNPCCWLHCVVLDSLIKLSEAFLLIHEISIFFPCAFCVMFVCSGKREEKEREI